MLAIAGIIYQGGVVTNRVQTTVDRVTKLEVENTARSTELRDLNLRGVRNEAKLDFLVQQAAAQEQRRTGQ
jgi:hypothetical protein